MSISRLIADVAGAVQVMPLSQALIWFSNIVKHAPSIVRTRHYYPADNAMSGVVRFTYLDKEISFDLAGAPERTFSWLREFFVRDNYFCAFDMRRMTLDNFLDLGCNVGRVSQIVKSINGGKREIKIVAVDADSYADNSVRASIAKDGGIHFIEALVVSGSSSNFDQAGYRAFTAKYGDTFNSNKTHITCEELVALFGDRRINFVKIDIEGAEFDIILNNNHWLHRADNLAMEVHSEFGNPSAIVDALRQLGFAVDWKGNHRKDVPVENADFIYGSRNGLLSAPK